MQARIRVIAPAGNTSSFEEFLQRWRRVGNTASDLSGQRFELQTSSLSDERVTVRPTVLIAKCLAVQLLF